MFYFHLLFVLHGVFRESLGSASVVWSRLVSSSWGVMKIMRNALQLLSLDSHPS